MNSNRQITVLAILASLFVVAPAIANQQIRAIESSYRVQRKALNDQLRANEEAIRCSYRDTIRGLNSARKTALRLCEPQKGHVLADIRAARRDAGERQRYDLKVVRNEHELACDRLKSWRSAARRVATTRVTTCRLTNVPIVNSVQNHLHAMPSVVFPSAPVNVTPVPAAIPHQPAAPLHVPTPALPGSAVPVPAVGPAQGNLQFPGPAPVNELPVFEMGSSSIRAERPREFTINSVDQVMSVLRVLLANR